MRVPGGRHPALRPDPRTPHPSQLRLDPAPFLRHCFGVSEVLPGAREFTTPVYGTVFARRSQVVQRLHPGDRLILVPDPPGAAPLAVWVHAAGGDVVGHLSPDVNDWLAPTMLDGCCYGAEVADVRGDEVASWKRLVIRVRLARELKSA